MNGQPKRTALGLPDLPDQANGRPNVEEMQEQYLIEKFGKRIFDNMEKDDMMISRGMAYGYELDEYIGRERERWAITGFVCGALVMCIMWMIVLGF